MYYVTVQMNEGIRSDCVPFQAKSDSRSDVVKAAVRIAALNGGTASLVSDGQGNRIANLDGKSMLRKRAHRMMYGRGEAA